MTPNRFLITCLLAGCSIVGLNGRGQQVTFETSFGSARDSETTKLVRLLGRNAI
jgi:hypothetical protein